VGESRSHAERDDIASLNGTRAKGADTNNGTKIHGLGRKTEAVEPATSETRIRRILELINAQSPRTISDLALEFNLRESHLQHLFKEMTGVGLGHLLTGQKLQKAALLLTDTSLRIKAIAAAVGYEHSSSFTRAFGQRFAQAPQAYRIVAKSGKCC
jgi:AraC-like DNA-binding protein